METTFEAPCGDWAFIGPRFVLNAVAIVRSDVPGTNVEAARTFVAEWFRNGWALPTVEDVIEWVDEWHGHLDRDGRHEVATDLLGHLMNAIYGI